MPDIDHKYMQRCIQLARLGRGWVAPNPMVGAVLVYEDRIIGEGYHRAYGQAHAEVNCIDSVQDDDKKLITASTLYVSLEPCTHFGKTPPCSDLIIRSGIPKVIIGSRDPFPAVNGKGIEKLLAAGIQVTTGVLENECRELNKRFFYFHTEKRPWILLKWAQTANGMIAGGSNQRLIISNEFTNRLVHRWRSAEAAILVGTNTALHDDPVLDNRLYTGKSPARLILDRRLRLPSTLRLFNGEQQTILFNCVREEKTGNPRYYLLEPNGDVPQQIAAACYEMNIQSVMIEGGAGLLNGFIRENRWNEARVITNNKLSIAAGIAAPRLACNPGRLETIFSDTIRYYFKDGNNGNPSK